MRSKLIIAFSTSFFLLLIFVLLFIYRQQFSITDIDADNYKEKLLKDSWKDRIKVDESETLILNLLSEDNPDKINFYNAWRDTIALSYNYNIEKNVGKNGRIFIKIFKNGTNENFYSLSYNTNMSPTYFMMNLNSGFLMKSALNNLIIKEGFILKKSRLIKGYDIIIKETEKSFIIGDIIPKYDELYPNEYGRYQLSLKIYSKKKYF
jgi:hypothetical protein